MAGVRIFFDDLILQVGADPLRRLVDEFAAAICDACHAVPRRGIGDRGDEIKACQCLAYRINGHFIDDHRRIEHILVAADGHDPIQGNHEVATAESGLPEPPRSR